MLVKQVASGAPKLLEKSLATIGERSLRAAAALPVVVRLAIHDGNPTDHPSVLVPTIFGAKKVIAAGFGGFEPKAAVVAGNNVVSDPKGGYGEAVNHVLRSHC